MTSSADLVKLIGNKLWSPCDSPDGTTETRYGSMRIVMFLFTLMLLSLLTGCLATKVVTIPMRIAGEVVGLVPVVGGVVEGAIDSTAFTADLVPL